MKKISHIYIFLSLLLVPFLTQGCGKSDGVETVPYQYMQRKEGMIIIYNASEAYCQDNVILSGVCSYSDYESVVIAMAKNDITCADYGKGSAYCESFIAKDEPGSSACLIGYDFVDDDDEDY